MDLSQEWVSAPASLFAEEQELQSHLPAAPTANPRSLYTPGVVTWIHWCWELGAWERGWMPACVPANLVAATWRRLLGTAGSELSKSPTGQLACTHSQARIWPPRCRSNGSSGLMGRRQSFVERTDQATACLGAQDLGLHLATLDPVTSFLSQGQGMVV